MLYDIILMILRCRACRRAMPDDAATFFRLFSDDDAPSPILRERHAAMRRIRASPLIRVEKLTSLATFPLIFHVSARISASDASSLPLRCLYTLSPFAMRDITARGARRLLLAIERHCCVKRISARRHEGLPPFFALPTWHRLQSFFHAHI